MEKKIKNKGTVGKTLGKILLVLIVALLGVFTVGYILTAGDHSVPETIAQDPSLPTITISEITFHGETFGDPSNPVVITLHGGPGSDYRSILSLQALADEYFVVFYDQRGSGLSPRVETDEITVESSIADLDAIVAYYGKGEKVNLVGHSWGAMLTSAYVGRYPEKVNHVVLSEPGFLTSAFAERFMEQTQIQFSGEILYYFVKTKFEALHVKGPDQDASNDFFTHQWNLYQGADHPQAGYRCAGSFPKDEETWRFGSQASNKLFEDAMDENGNIDINLVEGVENFKNTVLFLTGECQQVIGEEWQREQMQFFPNAIITVIPEAGHEIFLENPEASIEAVRTYLYSTP